MEKLKVGIRSLSPESNMDSGSPTGNFPPDQILIRTSPGRVVSLSACSKLCAISFAVGVVIGFTLKRRVRRWASKLLRRLKDD